MNPLPKQLRINTQPDAYGQAREDFYFVRQGVLQKVVGGEFWSMYRNNHAQYSKAEQRGSWQIWTLQEQQS